jgi:hypothetical protein
MLGKTITGVTKDTIRFTKPVGGILVVTNQEVKDLNGATAGVSNEQIGISLESGQEQIKMIQPKLSLLELAVMSTVGEGFILTSDKDATSGQPTKTALFVPIAPGTLVFGDTAELVVSLEGLKSAKSYEVYGVELPGSTSIFYQYSHVKVLAGRRTEQLSVTAADLVSVSSLAAVQKMDMVKVTAEDGDRVTARNHKYEAAEIALLISQTNDLVFGGVLNHGPNFKSMVLPVDMVDQIDLESDGTELDIILRKPTSL